jgi:acetyl-CoA C-acetyltransferase
VSFASKPDGLEFSEGYDIEGKFREARLYQVASISTVLILSYLGEHVLGMAKSYRAIVNAATELSKMRRVAFVSPVRTPVGTFGGSFRSVPVEELGAIVAKAVLAKTGLDPARIEDVVFAQSYANSETPCVGRWIALHAGLPIEIPGMQLDRRCGGGLQALITAAMMVQTGACDVVMAGGVESMSNIEYYSTGTRWGTRSGNSALYDRLDRGRERSQPEHRFGPISGMIETAENLAREYGISRAEADSYSALSHQRAAAAWKEGKFQDEVVPVTVPRRKEDPLVVNLDQGIRPETTREILARLPTLIEGGTVTAGNSSQQSDAAAACLVVAEDKLQELQLQPMGFLVGWAAAGCHPAMMGLGPVPAVERLFAKTGLSFDTMDLVELNEAFACQVLAVLRGWRWDDRSRLNVNGSGISLGHPIGATGVRMMTTLLHELKRRKGRYGLETMCVGGGQGLAAIVEAA